MYHKQWMIYGAYGYTGRLIAEKAVMRGMRPILGGKNLQKLKSLAKRLNLDFCCFDLAEPERIFSHIDQIRLLLNCAGPFTATSVPLAKACMRAGADYLDITGEIEVFEYLYSLDSKASETGTILCPGSGFDVIATDCLASALKKSMPDATFLSLALDSQSPLSPGTAKTIVEALKYKGMVRTNGVLKTVKLAHKVERIDFGSGPKMAVTIPWGAVSTVFYTTEIPDIEVYVALPESWIRVLRVFRIFRPIISREFFQKVLKLLIDLRITGPGPRERETTTVKLLGVVQNNQGQCLQARLNTSNGYDVTINGALGIVEKLFTQRPKPGVYTPSQLMGTHYISQLPGCGPITIF